MEGENLRLGAGNVHPRGTCTAPCEQPVEAEPLYQKQNPQQRMDSSSPVSGDGAPREGSNVQTLATVSSIPSSGICESVTRLGVDCLRAARRDTSVGAYC